MKIHAKIFSVEPEKQPSLLYELSILFFYCLFPARMAHGNIGVVTPDKYLTALGHDFAVRVNSRVNDSLFTA